MTNKTSVFIKSGEYFKRLNHCQVLKNSVARCKFFGRAHGAKFKISHLSVSENKIRRQINIFKQNHKSPFPTVLAAVCSFFVPLLKSLLVLATKSTLLILPFIYHDCVSIKHCVKWWWAGGITRPNDTPHACLPTAGRRSYPVTNW